MLSVREQIIRRHFAAKTLRALKKKGIEVMSTTFIPDASGDYTRGETAYNINDNDTGRVMTFLEVLALAQ
ncbi:hypothetical protein PHIM7_333 [Sinorhizobium phage phiM7]|uniref:Uncharacterized protein n=3 Tax=Emdodecavirus TaxID=1980937 RepID=S5MQD6_9CAUD|nr:hypothetical protein AB690_gp181 [Sinorhizobium phage phiM12]YP_009212578.1 hypothetical protein AVT40_gp195 [Sinorhizobium phage phiN3]YP_009601458.1 hypothetical protein FDH46_gp145 [Sinorhizobium phage phiM7]AKF13238.1 hypothetical protein PHIM19_333 [Sinorhizobium phage phiM19]AGR48060.1 hypothetical protein SmphiM12_428 [Sinorhizobium phage phiM12]AKF12878.1 hypothetical protein PHIM7_333 [Sinorhizobium phage phiM7]AKF13601.1 hypothetical protein PHIN3_338 [Sinorhizobium phage phiN3]